jgi:thioester reductase-like protein
MDKICVALTGATGLLGRNLLFEFIKRYKNELDKLQIIILGRGEDQISLFERIKNIIFNDGIHYIGVDSEKEVLSFIHKGMQCIDVDLRSNEFGISLSDMQKLTRAQINFFFSYCFSYRF